jgi:ADP-ribose pyrophosphatase YjhB (NUDIX family)
VEYRFCPSCGAPAEPRRLKAGEPDRPVCTRCGLIVYVDPKVAVGTIINYDGDRRIVLVRRAIEPGYGLWVFPGGYVDRGEAVTDAAVREAREEAGLDIRIDSLLNIYSYPGAVPVIIVYAATRIGGELCYDEECLEAAVFSEADVPWNALAFRSTGEALREYFAKKRV